MKPGIVQKIFKDHFDTYRKTRVLCRRQYHAAGNIMTCRTSEKGYHIDACPNGDYEILMHNSCKHRSCPLCGCTETQLWLERRKRQALNCRYFHVTMTISHDLHPLWRYNRKVFTNLMMRGAWHSLRELLADLKWLGALPGAVAVFQSWDDELNKLGRKRWHADIEEPYDHANGVFKYVGRYIRRGSISERRIIGYDKNTVTIAYAHKEKHEDPDFTVNAQIFVDRFLSHVPAKGSHLVRSYGLFHPNCRKRLDIARDQLGQQPYEAITELPNTQELLKQMFPDKEVNLCPNCGSELRTVYVYRRGQAPTWRLAA